MLDQEELGGILGLGIAVLYERSLQNQSPWFDYFTALGSFEAVDAPLFWNEMQLRWLVNTDLGRSIAQDKEFLVCALARLSNCKSATTKLMQKQTQRLTIADAILMQKNIPLVRN